MTDLNSGCLCLRCYGERTETRSLSEKAQAFVSGHFEAIRYACELCGNKRCPHHSDHRLECTRSNKSGQPGSVL